MVKTGWCWLFVALAACHDAKVEKAEADLVASKARIATLKARKPDLEAKLKQSEQSRWQLAEQADEAALAAAQLGAADDVLEGKPLAPAFALPGMIASKNKDDVVEFATSAAQGVLPCLPEGSPNEEHEDYGRGMNCDPPPVEDTCAAVAQRNAIAGKWACETKIEGAGKVPPLVACTLTAEYPPSAADALNAVNGTIMSRTLVRAAFTHAGHLFVADFPAPGIDTYQPANELELASCKTENERLGCERTCDMQFNRLDRPDCGMGADGYGEGPTDDDSDVPEEVKAARARAAEAEKDAQAARDELGYQECHAACRPAVEAERRKSADAYKYVSSPAPGVLAYARTLESPADTSDEVAALLKQADLAGIEEGQKLRAKAEELGAKTEERRFLMLLKFAEYNALATGAAPEAGEVRDHMLPLQLLTELEDGVLKAPEKDGHRMVYGFGDKRALKTFTLDAKGALAELDAADACKKIAGDSEASAPVKAACKEHTP